MSITILYEKAAHKMLVNFTPGGQEVEMAKAFSNEQFVDTFPTINNWTGRPGSGCINPFTKESLQSVYCFWYNWEPKNLCNEIIQFGNGSKIETRSAYTLVQK